MPEPLAPNTILQNRYRLLQVLGGGGMGRVYLAQDFRLAGAHVAVKELVDTYLPQAERAQAVQLFYQEAAQLARLRHPAIPHVSDHFAEGGRLYLVMEYVPGETLENILNRTPGFLPEATLRDWAVQLCDVLEYLHSQQPPIIFRDLKPANVMVTPEGRIKLIDFGIARLFDPRKATDTLKMGTLGYAPPEQYAGRGQTDAVSDVYALGATLHHLATRRDPRQEPPFSFPPPRTLNPALSPAFERVIMRALKYERAERFPSATAMRQALQAGGAAWRGLGWAVAAGGSAVALAGLILCIALTILLPIPPGPPASPTITPKPTRPPASTQTPWVVLITTTPTPTVRATSTPIPPATLPPTLGPTGTRQPAGTPATPTRGTAAPILLSPADGAVFEGRSAAIPLRWQPIGRELAADEYYVVSVPYKHNGVPQEDGFWTKSTGWNLAEHTYLCERADGGRLEWFVTVKRKTGTTPEGWNTGVAVGPSSDRRSLTWRCETAPPIPTPHPGHQRRCHPIHHPQVGNSGCLPVHTVVPSNTVPLPASAASAAGPWPPAP